MRFFFNDTATTEIYTLSLHDALPILLGTDSLTLVPGPVSGNASVSQVVKGSDTRLSDARTPTAHQTTHRDRKSTRLNSSHQIISYAVFCLKKKKLRGVIL